MDIADFWLSGSALLLVSPLLSLPLLLGLSGALYFLAAFSDWTAAVARRTFDTPA